MPGSKFCGVLTRRRLQAQRPGLDFNPVYPLGIAPFFARVIDAGLCSYRDCRDTLSLDEVCDLNEVLVARVENERRSDEAAERRSKPRR